MASSILSYYLFNFLFLIRFRIKIKRLRFNFKEHVAVTSDNIFPYLTSQNKA